MLYRVLVDDNFHALDPEYRYELGTYPSFEEARAAAQQFIDTYLQETYRPGMSASHLFQLFTLFGEDPFIVAPDLPSVAFSSWDYARQRCEAICAS
jgi:hypothetical protein